MTNSTKDQLAADFEKVKNAGGVRVERIRQIFQDALTQTVTELKQGTGEIRSIAKESTSTLTESLKNTQKPEPQNQVVPIQVEIQDESAETTIAVVETADEVVVEVTEPTPVNPLTAEHPQMDAQAEAEDSSQSAESATAESLLDSLKALVEQVMTSFKAGEAYTVLQQQLGRLKEHMATLDGKLSERYGERYEHVKQEFNQDVEKTKGWYEGMKANADANDMSVLEYKQAELVIKMGEVGMTIAQKEEKIKQLLKELWQTATKF